MQNFEKYHLSSSIAYAKFLVCLFFSQKNLKFNSQNDILAWCVTETKNFE